MGQKLSDIHINFVQQLLKHQFPTLNGPLLITKEIPMKTSVQNKLQIFHSCGDHWITASSVKVV